MTTTQFQDWIVCAMRGRLDSFNLRATEEKIVKIFHDGNTKIALNVSEVEFINMPMIRFLIEFSRMLVEKNGELGIVGPNPTVAKHLDVYASRTDLKIYRDLVSFEKGEVVASKELYKHCPSLGL